MIKQLNNAIIQSAGAITQLYIAIIQSAATIILHNIAIIQNYGAIKQKEVTITKLAPSVVLPTFQKFKTFEKFSSASLIQSFSTVGIGFTLYAIV